VAEKTGNGPQIGGPVEGGSKETRDKGLVVWKGLNQGTTVLYTATARSRKLLEQLPPEHAGQIFANPLTGNRQVLSQLKATRQAMRHDMTAISSGSSQVCVM